MEPMPVGPPAMSNASVIVEKEPTVYAPGLLTSPSTNIGIVFKEPIVMSMFAPTICCDWVMSCLDISSNVIPAT